MANSSTQYFERYGTRWPRVANDLQVEMACIYKGGRWQKADGTYAGLGLYEHFARAERLLWPEDDVHRWSALCLQALCENPLSVLLGPSDANKTYIASKWALMEYWAAPTETLVLVSSTDLRGLELRVWGAIKDLFNRARARWDCLDGHPIDSLHCITTHNVSEERAKARVLKMGIICIPCLQSGRYVGLGKFSGIKQKRLRKISDECFPSGTLVDTPTGQKRIEQIQPGDRVWNAGGIGIVRGVRSQCKDSLTRVRVKDGREIVCTDNHKFFTQKGWVAASNLGADHYIFSAYESMQILRHTDHKYSFLQQELSGKMDNNYAGRTGVILKPKHAKALVARGSQVKSSQVLKLKDFARYAERSGRVKVFNLHVEAHHSFSVNGLLAANCQFMGPSHLDADANLMGKGDYKSAYLGNPVDVIDPLGRIAEPLDGWGSVQNITKTTTWRTKMGGICVNLVGTDSPNFDYPVDEPIRFPYLINRKKIDAVAEFWGMDSVQFSSQCVGVMRPGLTSRRIITRQMCQENFALAKALWADTHRTKVYACDAAYKGVGGDRCVVGWAEFGESLDGAQVLRINPPKIVPISVIVKKEAEDQIAEFIQKDSEAVEIKPNDIFYDSTGRGTLGAAFAKLFGNQTPVPVEFGGKPSTRPVRHDLFMEEGREKRHKRCDEHYLDFVSELWFSMAYIILCQQMRELPEDVMMEGCAREYGRTRANKLFIESKHDKKARERMVRSPDLADWLATICEGARQRGFQIAKLGAALTEFKNDDWITEERRTFRDAIKGCLLAH